MAKQRRGKSPRGYSRRGPVKEPYHVVLMVCEGSKTEPNYLRELRSIYRLSSANVIIVHPNATDPLSIIHAAARALNSGEYDRIYCIFDRDDHANYDLAVQRIAEYPKKIFAINSVPCFEVWILLHFKYSSSPFSRTGMESACDKFLREVALHISDYKKGDMHIFIYLTC